MPVLQVTIEAIVRKTLSVEEETEKQAIEEAHAPLTVQNQLDVDEDYDETTAACEFIGTEACDPFSLRAFVTAHSRPPIPLGGPRAAGVRA